MMMIIICVIITIIIIIIIAIIAVKVDYSSQTDQARLGQSMVKANQR